jgi:hypothetical protein
MPVAGRHSKVYKFRIVLDQPPEVAYWMRTLNATEGEIREAIAAVGDHALRVREHLDQRNSPAATS